MKKCPFCAEEIQDEAIKCRFCGEFLEVRSEGTSRNRKWYFSTSAVVIALLVVGPLALPLVWFNPRYKIITKVVVTAIVVAITILCFYLIADLYSNLMKQVKALGIR